MVGSPRVSALWSNTGTKQASGVGKVHHNLKRASRTAANEGKEKQNDLVQRYPVIQTDVITIFVG